MLLARIFRYFRIKKIIKVTAMLAEDYVWIGKVNLEKDAIFDVRATDVFLRNIHSVKRSKSFVERVFTLAENIVAEEDKELFLASTNREIINKGLLSKNSHIVNFRANVDGQVRYWQIKCVRDREDKDCVIVGIHDIDEDTRDEMLYHVQADLLNSFLLNYSSVYRVNFDKDEAYIYKRNTALNLRYGGSVGSYVPYTENTDRFIHENVYERDIDHAHNYINIDNLRRVLELDRSFTDYFRVVLDEKVYFYEVHAVAIEEEGPVRTALLGFTDKNEEYLEEAVTDHIYEEYESVFYVDLKADRYKVFKMPSVLDLEGREEGTFSKLTIEFSKMVAPEYEKLFAGMADLEYLRNSFINEPKREFIYYLPDDEAHPWRRGLYQVMEEEDGVATAVLLSFMDIDSYRAKELDLNKKIAKQKDELDKGRGEIEKARIEAENANNAKTLFLFNMSHDIRTPMNAITGFTALAKKHVDDRDRVIDCLNKIEVSSTHLLELINDVLDMSRIEAGKVSIEEISGNITNCIEETLLIMREAAENKGIKIDFVKENVTEEVLYFDPLRINQIMLNIISNSIKYTGFGGSIRCTLRQFESKRPGFGTYEFEVEDNGIGMSPDYAEHIFEAFSREKNTTVSHIQGTGLGMTIVKRYVDLMGGNIIIRSELDMGTRITIRVDLRFSKGEAEPFEESDTIDLFGKRILLVEDNELNREIAYEILKEEGMMVETAEDGKAAVRAVENNSPGYYDLILMDIQMPKMNGYEATEAIRKLPELEKAGIPIIAMTANAFDSDRRAALEAGMNEHISKPINIKEMLRVIKTYI